MGPLPVMPPSHAAVNLAAIVGGCVTLCLPTELAGGCMTSLLCRCWFPTLMVAVPAVLLLLWSLSHGLAGALGHVLNTEQLLDSDVSPAMYRGSCGVQGLS